MAVIGPGPIGLLGVAIAKSLGASPVFLIGTRNDRLEIGKKLGASADKFSLGAVAKETIEERLADEQLHLVRRMINKRFGPDTWDEIIEERKIRIEKHNKAVKKEKQKKQESNEKLYKILETVAGYIFLIVTIVGVGAYIWWAKK